MLHDVFEGGLGGPRHRTVSLVLADGIATGRYPLGGLLPGEEALAKMFQVSRVTIRRALSDLVAAGLIDRRHGSGTFVKKSPTHDHVNSIDRLLGQVARAGKLEVAVLEFEYCVPQPVVRRLLMLDQDQKVQKAVRVRSRRNKTPILHLTTFVPEALGRTYSRKDLGRHPLYRLLSRAGKGYNKARQNVGACLADPMVGASLNVPVGAPLVFIQRVLFTEEDEPVEYLELKAPPDLYALSMSWTSDGAMGFEHAQFVQKSANL